MNRAVRWQALALVAGLTVSMQAGAAAPAPAPQKAPKATKPAAAEAPKPAPVAAPKAQRAEAPKAQQAALSGGVFGQKGQLVISSDASLLFGYTTAGDYGAIRILPAADYFLMDNLSLGASATLGFAFGDSTGLTLGLAPRAGYNLKLGENVSLWPRASLGFLVIDEANLAADSVLGTQGFNFQVDLYAPFLFHVTPSFFVGIGPRVGMSIGDAFDVAFMLDTTLGGHF
jgi:hypothetical protein